MYIYTKYILCYKQEDLNLGLMLGLGAVTIAISPSAARLPLAIKWRRKSTGEKFKHFTQY